MDSKNVVMFQQNEIPSFLDNGKMLLSTKSKIARAPDGNGGLYSSMVNNNIVEHMSARGVSYIHIYGVRDIDDSSTSFFFGGGGQLEDNDGAYPPTIGDLSIR